MEIIILSKNDLFNVLYNDLGYTNVIINRSSVLGNPYLFEDEDDRENSIAAYRKWLWDCIKSWRLDGGRNTIPQPSNHIVEGLTISKKWKRPTAAKVIDELYRIAALKKVVLICWCKYPNVLCHGNVVKSCIEWLQNCYPSDFC